MLSRLVFFASLVSWASAQVSCDGDACPSVPNVTDTRSPFLLQRRSTAEKMIINDEDYDAQDEDKQDVDYYQRDDGGAAGGDDYYSDAGTPAPTRNVRCKSVDLGRGKGCLEGKKISPDGKCTPVCTIAGEDPSSDKQLTCIGGTFDGSFECGSVQCQASALSHIANSDGCEEGETVEARGKCTLQCKSGYKKVGKVPLRCMGGKFTMSDITCEGQMCDAPEKVQTGVASCKEGKKIESGSRCTAQCKENFAPTVHSLACEGGVLTPSTYECSPQSCVHPILENSHADGSCLEAELDPDHGVCTPQCAAGYVAWPPTSFQTIACVDGKLNGTFSCEKPDPIPPPGIKRGAGIGNKANQINHASQYAWGDAVGWWYSWSPNVVWPEGPYWNSEPGKALLAKSNYVPQMGREFELNAEGWDSMYEGSPYVLGLNEPYGELDLKGREKHFSPHHAYDVWPQWEAKKKAIELKTGSKVQLISHSISAKDKARDWASETFGFFGNISKHFDFIAVHWYRCNLEDMLDGLDKIYTMFKMPIWLTEFNCGSYTIGRPANLAEQRAHMERSLPILDAHPHVVRYTWYSDETGNDGYDASLFHGNEMTVLGKIYNNFREGEPAKSCQVPNDMPGAADIPCEEGSEIPSQGVCTPVCKEKNHKATMPTTGDEKYVVKGLYCTLGVLSPATFSCDTRGRGSRKKRLSLLEAGEEEEGDEEEENSAGHS